MYLTNLVLLSSQSHCVKKESWQRPIISLLLQGLRDRWEDWRSWNIIWESGHRRTKERKWTLAWCVMVPRARQRESVGHAVKKGSHTCCGKRKSWFFDFELELVTGRRGKGIEVNGWNNFGRGAPLRSSNSSSFQTNVFQVFGYRLINENREPFPDYSCLRFYPFPNKTVKSEWITISSWTLVRRLWKIQTPF